MNAIQKLQQGLSEETCAFVESEVNRRYLSGFASTEGLILVFPDAAHFFLDFRYFEMGVNAQNAGIIPKDLTLERDYTLSRIKEVLAAHQAKTVLFEDERMTCARLARLQKNHPDLAFSPMGELIEELRASKTPEEIARIRAAQQITDAAFLHVLDCFSPNATDTGLAAEIDCFFKRAGAENAFETILVSGPRTSLPHGTPCGMKLVKNGFVTMDFGAKLDGYCSDMTRTVVFGKATDEMKRVYQTVFDAQAAGFAAIRAGVTGKEVDLAARKLIDDAGYQGCFGHSLGHSLGLEIHENPNYSPRSEAIIPCGAVLSVEPGIYLEGKFGVRIEDIAVVTENGYENLTKSEKSLIEL